ncbi:hypothetical protein OPT61_g8623 [Boeremia exigua]|uniref:Uncharacterized protein n=1 Tax=Boeremia exigua TaxID=749465 RepID=A0ACC2HYP1_9PLEO|nr:hypothetical protein OPT61_g8623 [Boeremia exigua]
MAHSFNPGARKFDPNGRLFDPNGRLKNNLQDNSAPQQVSAPPSPYLEARLLNLEVAHADLRGEVDTLKELYCDLQHAFGKVNQHPQDTDPVKSRQTAAQFKRELEQMSHDVHAAVNGHADNEKVNGNGACKPNGSVPPHMRAASVASHESDRKSLPPHLRGSKQSSAAKSSSDAALSLDTKKHEHDPLITDGPVDTIIRQPSIPTAVPSPPLSPSSTLQGDDLHNEAAALSLADWKPCYLSTLPQLPADIRAKIPAKQGMATFTYDMLQNTFGGIAWSPGLKYINKAEPPLLQNRTYYMLDPKHEPYLPKTPGEHGAKLTAFFNRPPEEEFDNLPEGTNSYTNVPMFIRVSQGRYVYFGNYSQTRWSDKLDNDTMKARVPQHVKDYIAKDLATLPREKWVTEELKKHFFPKPEYEGTVLVPTNDGSTITTVDEEKHSKRVASDVKDYIQDLAEWEREANMKTAMIKSDFILNAFDAADADDPPALRLWWEYLECVEWKPDFYNMLVGLQARADNSK